MDRRDFFKTVLATPILTPLLLAAKTTKSDLELFLITDDPHVFLPPLLKELEKYAPVYDRNIALLNSHPDEEMIKNVLARNNWKHVQEPAKAGLTLSFSTLREKALPSFTLVKGGRVWDIRSHKLSSLWEEMNRGHKPSSWLTVASVRTRKSGISAGKEVTLYRDGRKIETLSLKKNVTKSFKAKGGRITVMVKDGRAWVAESSCSQKICLYTPPASLAGERIICAPNHFLLEVKGSAGVDTVIG